MGLEKINDMRRSLGWGLEELSKKSGIPISTLSKIAAGVTKDPKLETIKSIVHCMGYTLDDLDSMEPKNSPVPANAETGELDKQEQILIHNYRALNDEGQEKLLEYSTDLVLSGRYTKNNQSALPTEA